MISGTRRSQWQKHHLIPRALWQRRQFADLLSNDGVTRREGEACNIVILPSCEMLAAATGLALHRGPHPHYSDVVAARLDRLLRSRLAPADADRHLTLLQRALARVLTGRAPRLLNLNRNDPMRLFGDYSSLDSAISQFYDPPDA